MPKIKKTEVYLPPLKKIEEENLNPETVLNNTHYDGNHFSSVVAGSFTRLNDDDPILTATVVVNPLYDFDGVQIGFTAATASGKKTKLSEIKYRQDPPNTEKIVGNQEKNTSSLKRFLSKKNNIEDMKEKQRLDDEKKISEIEESRKKYYTRVNQNIAEVAFASCNRYVELTEKVEIFFNKRYPSSLHENQQNNLFSPDRERLNNGKNRLTKAQTDSDSKNIVNNQVQELYESEDDLSIGLNQNRNEIVDSVEKENIKDLQTEERRSTIDRALENYIKTQIRKAGLFGSTKISQLAPEKIKTNLMTTTLLYQQEGKYKAILGNVGDGMILVVDKDGNLKSNLGLNPKKNPDSMVGSSTAYLTAQILGNVHYRDSYEVKIIENLQAGDRVIHLTSEIWNKCFECGIPDQEKFKGLSGKPLGSLLEMTKAIANWCVENQSEATLFAVMEVPDEKVELVRAFLQSNDPRKMCAICERILANNFSTSDQSKENDYVKVSQKLRTEVRSTDGSGSLKQDELVNQNTNIQNFIAHYERIKKEVDSGVGKKEKAVKFELAIAECGDLTLPQIKIMDEIFRYHPAFASHQSPVKDYILNVNQTNSQKEVLIPSRKIFKGKLWKALRSDSMTPDEKLTLAKWARGTELICLHTKSFWQGGFGRTQGEKDLDKEIKELTKVLMSPSLSKNSDV